jgi:hypothetical protein
LIVTNKGDIDVISNYAILLSEGLYEENQKFLSSQYMEMYNEKK